MAFDLGKKKGPISDINVTPLVDVMLVLLVIFMISAPLMFSGIQLDLPKTKKVNKINLTKKQVILSLTSTGEMVIDGEKYLVAEIVNEVLSRFKENKTDILYLRGDYSLEYGKIARVMATLKRGGVAKIALITEIEKVSK